MTATTTTTRKLVHARCTNFMPSGERDFQALIAMRNMRFNREIKNV
jgi:hypothetical protein